MADRAPIRVLLVEDDEDDYVLTRDLLEDTGEPFSVDWAATYEDGLAAIGRAEHDVYLVDYRLGAHNAGELLQAAGAPRSDIPFIVFTGTDARTTDLAAMHAGADDFVAKATTSPWLLERTIRYAIERRHLMRQVRDAQHLEMLATLAGGFAHDFNNLLTAILGYAQVAAGELGRDADSELRHAVEEITRAGDRGTELTRQLLAYAGHAQPGRVRLDPAATVGGMHDSLSALLPPAAHLDLTTDPLAPAVVIGEQELSQLARQLVANAAEALESGRGRVGVDIARAKLDAHALAGLRHGADLTPGVYCRLTVTDNGSGMAAETAARAFEPFYSTKFTGRGLGLAAVDGIVRANSGAIRLATQAGSGTTVDVLLPAAG
jgi:signal transduction histidine kinase